MSAIGLLAGFSVLLGGAALRELFRDHWLAGGTMIITGLGELFGLAERRRLARAALRLGLPERISRSGLGASLPLAAVLFAKLACGIVGGFVAFLAAPAAPGRFSVLVACALPAAGFLIPDALLERRARRRSGQLLGALPDACDLLAVGAASGRGIASGFAEIAAAGQGPLATELRIAVAELSCGTPIATTLRSLRGRIPGSEMATLCAAIERSRRYGSPLADQLRRQSASLRRDQRRAVEEHAARAAPKIQLVVALILVPSVLLMITAALIANADLLLSGY